MSTGMLVGSTDGAVAAYRAAYDGRAPFRTLVTPAGTYPGLRLDALSTLFYVANWQQVAAGHSYFTQFQAAVNANPTSVIAATQLKIAQKQAK